MIRNAIAAQIQAWFPAPEVHAHCDGPCGVYDPASARITAEAVLSMTKKILDLEVPAPGDAKAMVAYQNTLSRYISIKEEQAQKTKEDLLILWTDYFKPVHLEKYPDLHDTFWKAAKLCSACKVEVSIEHANELMAVVETIHTMFWARKSGMWHGTKPAKFSPAQHIPPAEQCLRVGVVVVPAAGGGGGSKGAQCCHRCIQGIKSWWIFGPIGDRPPA